MKHIEISCTGKNCFYKQVEVDTIQLARKKAQEHFEHTAHREIVISTVTQEVIENEDASSS